MARIITSGTGRNLQTVAGKQELDPSERKFVTYVTETGAVHTVIVDVEHAAEDAVKLIEWFDHTRTAVEHGGFSHPDEVIKYADEASGIVKQEVTDVEDTASDAEKGRWF